MSYDSFNPCCNRNCDPQCEPVCSCCNPAGVIQGPQGVQGPQGLQGNVGATGPQGPTGPAAAIPCPAGICPQYIFGDKVEVAPNTAGYAFAKCPAGTSVIGGSANIISANNILRSDGPFNVPPNNGWAMGILNNSDASVQIQSIAICAKTCGDNCLPPVSEPVLILLPVPVLGPI